MDKLRGELVSFKVFGTGGWGIGQLRTQHDGGTVTITGTLLGVHAGDTLEVEGGYENHAKYGRQFKFRTCTTVLAQDKSGVVGWLASKLPQISRRRAEQLVELYGVEGLWAKLDAGDVTSLCVVDGITPPRAEEILGAYRAHKAERDRLVRFKQWGLTDGQVARVLDEWGDDAEERIQRNPYDLIEFVHGFGWTRADQVALRMGLPVDSIARCAAALLHNMNEAKGQGHCYWTDAKLVAVTTKKTLELADHKPVWTALEQLITQGKLVRLEARIYLPGIAVAEGRLAKVFATRARAAQGGRAA
jgi:exodeoxyribonuclease V alpha subunit